MRGGKAAAAKISGRLRSMIFFLTFVFCIFFFCFFISRKYSNPYRLIFIFGKKGSGKSCYMVKKMLWHLKHGWNVYTDIQDINIPGVRVCRALDLKDFVPDNHSALFLDEAGILFDNRRYRDFPEGLRDFFKLQRKYKVRLYMNSQSFDIDKKIRDVTDSMILQTSILNCISISRPIIRSITLTEPTAEAESRIADKLKFDKLWNWEFYWMPNYFKYFDSFSAPERPSLPYRTIPEALKEKPKLKGKSA